MLQIEFRFPAGRFHATPWDHHVNEGVVEWPPSPWRFLRALVATWHLKARSDVQEEQVRRIVELLAGELPEYVLPSARAAHLRHYMPLYSGKTTKVFDTFLDLRDGAVVMAFTHVDLDPLLITVLDVLLDRMGYLGRAESWVEARRVESTVHRFNTTPVVGSDGDSSGGADIVGVLVPWSADEYSIWRQGAVEARLQNATEELRSKAARKGKEAQSAKLTKTQVAREEARLPVGIFEAVLVDTGEMRKAGWDRPPGSRWVDYRRPSVDLAPRRIGRRRTEELPTVARFAVSSSVLPRITRAISVGNRVRVSLMSRSDGAAVFAGHEGETVAPMLGHRHVHVLPECHRDDDRISHLTLWAPLGFGRVARAALDGISEVWSEHREEIRLVLLGVGSPADFPWDPKADPGRDPGCPYFATCSVWRSLTPFVPTRFPKTTKGGSPKRDGDGVWIGSPEHDLARLLGEGGYPRPAIVPLERARVGQRSLHWLDFQTARPNGNGRRSMRGVAGWTLQFESPMQGPIAVGYGAHYGLGLFAPVAKHRVEHTEASRQERWLIQENRS